MDKELGYFKLTRSASTSFAEEQGAANYDHVMSEALGLNAVDSSKILHFRQNAPRSANGTLGQYVARNKFLGAFGFQGFH